MRKVLELSCKICYNALKDGVIKTYANFKLQNLKGDFKMKKQLSLLLAIIMGLTLIFSLAGCQPEIEATDENQKSRTVIELNESNYWKYININFSGNHDDEKPAVSYEINGVLDYAFYEDVVLAFDVIYYADGQPEEEYLSYTMRIACNAAGDAKFETTYLGTTNVSVGKWLGVDGDLISFINYNWKIHFKSVSGKVIYTA